MHTDLQYEYQDIHQADLQYEYQDIHTIMQICSMSIRILMHTDLQYEYQDINATDLQYEYQDIHHADLQYEYQDIHHNHADLQYIIYSMILKTNLSIRSHTSMFPLCFAIKNTPIYI